MDEINASEVFSTLNPINVSKHTENKQGLTYLSWSYAWEEVKKKFPLANYEVVKNEQGLPYFYDEKTGYMVYTRVTINGLTHEMWLPVMNGANKAMKAEPYTYETTYKGQKQEKTVEAATMMEINKAVMRCLTKNLAMHGMGLYIYEGEDLPEMTAEERAMHDELKMNISKKDADTLAKILNDDQMAWVIDRYHITTLYELTNEQYGQLMRTINERKNDGK